MATKIKHKRSSVPGKKPIVSQLESGELAINTADGKVFLLKDDNTVQDLTQKIFETDTRVEVNDPGIGQGTITATVDGSDKMIITDSTVNIYENVDIENAKGITFRELTASGEDGITIKAPDNLPSSYTLNLPFTDGTVGQVIRTNGSGQLEFVDADIFGGNVIYVSAEQGDDANDGQSAPVKTVKRACQLASGLVYNADGTPNGVRINIKVAVGDYTEQNPVIVPDNVVIKGDGLRGCIIRPANANQDMLRVRNGCYFGEFTFRDGVDANFVPLVPFDYAVAFDDPDDIFTSRVGYTNLPTTKPTITVSPYVQNCSIISFLGGNGAKIDGSKVNSPNVPVNQIEAENPVFGAIPEQGKSMVANAFTMLMFGGTGWRLTNDAYAQIVSCFQIFLLNGVYCQSGGYCSITNSATNFGLYALRASGFSPKAFLFDRAYVVGTGVSAGSQTLTIVGINREAPVEEFVVKFRNPEYRLAHDRLIENQVAIAQATVDWINSQIAGAVPGSIWDGFTYDETKCYRDTLLIVEAVAKDTWDTGNRYTRSAGLAYYNKNLQDSSAILIPGEIEQTIAAIEQASVYAASYIAELDSTVKAFVDEKFDIVKSILSDPDSVPDPTEVSSEGDITNLFKPAPTATEFDAAIQVNPTTNIFTIVGHGFSNGQKVIYDSNGNTTIRGLDPEQTYYVKIINNDEFTLAFDDSLDFDVNIIASSTGIHKFLSNVQEFYVNEILNSHQTYQTLILDPGAESFVFVPGRAITGTTGTQNNSAFVYSWEPTLRRLVVSVELVAVGSSTQRVQFDETSTINSDHADTPNLNIGITSVAAKTGLGTATFSVLGTVDGAQLVNLANLPENQVWFHRPSIVNSSGHTWEYAGSGTDYNALPQNGGNTRVEYEQFSELPGRVYSSGTNELGDFKVGDFITAFNRTGNITFRNKVTVDELDVLRLAFSDIVIEEISKSVNLGDDELGGPSDSRLSTQLSIRSFLSNRLGGFIDKTVSTAAVPGAIVQLNTNGQLNPDLIPATRQFTNTNTPGYLSRLEQVDEIPAVDLKAGDIATEEYEQLEVFFDLGVTANDGDTISLGDYKAHVKGSYVNSTNMLVASIEGTFPVSPDSILLGAGTVSINGIDTGASIVDAGIVSTITDNYFLKSSNTSQFLILDPNETYTFTSASISTVARSANVATISTTANHNLNPGNTVQILCNEDTTFNVNGVVITTPTATSFTIANIGSTVTTTSVTGTVRTIVTSADGNAQGAVTETRYGVLTNVDNANITGGSGYIPALGTQIYEFIPLISLTGNGTGAYADITVTAGAITDVDIRRGGTGYAVGDMLTIDSTDFVDGTLDPSTGTGFIIDASAIENRAYVNILGGELFVASASSVDFVEDNNAITSKITVTLTDTISNNFLAGDSGSGGNVDYINNRINITAHGYTSGDPVTYDTLGNVAIGGLLNGSVYYIKKITDDSVEVYADYSLLDKIEFLSTPANNNHNFTRYQVNVTNNSVIVPAHGYTTGDAVRIVGSTLFEVNGTVVPSGSRFFVGSVTTNSFTLHDLRSDALSSINGLVTNARDITDAGSGSADFIPNNVQVSSVVNTSSRIKANWNSLAVTNIDASNIISGVVSPSRLAGTGVANTDTFLRGDSSYQVVVQKLKKSPTVDNPITLTGSNISEEYYGETVQIGVSNVDLSPGDQYSTLGVSRFLQTQFDVASDASGQVFIKDGVVDAGTLDGLDSSYFLNPANLTSAVPVNRGGTNLTTYAVGDIIYAASTGTLNTLNIGRRNSILKSNGTTPEWGTALDISEGLDVGSATLTSSSTGTGQVYNTNVTTLELGGAAENVKIGASTSTRDISTFVSSYDATISQNVVVNLSSFTGLTNGAVGNAGKEVPMSSTTGILAGMIVTGSASIPANTTVSGVTTEFIYLSNVTTGTIPSGTTLTFTYTPITLGIRAGDTVNIAGSTVTNLDGSWPVIGATVNATSFTIQTDANVTANPATPKSGTISKDNTMVIRNRRVIFGSAEGSAAPVPATLRGEDGIGTNVAGGDFVVQAGLGTGNATGGDFIVKTGATSTSSDFKQSPTTRLTIDTEGNAAFTTNVSIAGNVSIPDNSKINVGTGNDLQIYHDGANSYIDDAGTGVLAIRSNSVRLQKYTGEEMVQADADGAVTLYHDNVAKFATTSTGVSVSGEVAATTVTTTGDIVVGGNLTVNGTTTTINTTELSVDDINITLGATATPSDVSANGGGITLKGSTDKTINWIDATDAWTASEHWDLASSKEYRINSNSVLSSTTLGSGVVNSSLQTVGTIGTGIWQGTIISPTYGGTGINNGNKTITLGGNLTTSGAFTTTLTVTGNTNVTLPTSGTLAITGNGLNQFASTTSAQLAGVISDETGSGSLVFGTSPTITTSIVAGSATMAIFNTTATTVNAFGAATALTIGATTGTTTIRNATVTLDGDLNVNGGDLATNQTTFNLVNNNATTVNFAGAATDLQIGAATGTTNVNNNLTVDLDLAVNGGDLTTTATTFNLVNTNATTVNFAGGASSIVIGAATSTVRFVDNVDVDGDLNVDGTLTITSLNNTPIGNSTASTGAFTTLTSNGLTTFTNNTASTSTTSGAVVVTGGVGIGGAVYADSFHGDIDASQITSGTFNDARISVTNVTQHQASITGVGTLTSGSIANGFGNINIGTSIFTGNGSGLTDLNASNISTGTVQGSVLGGNQTMAGVKSFSDTSDASSTSSGAVRIAGGLGVAKNLYALAFYGDGANVTSLNATNISSGTINDARLPTSQTGKTFTSDISVNGHKVGRGGGNSATNLAIAGGQSISSGTDNMIVGIGAGAGIVTGTDNTALGNSALAALTSATHNTAVGNDSQAQRTSTGNFNTSVGAQSMSNSTSGDNNAAFGYQALELVIGSQNIGIGSQAGDTLTSGSNNILIGYNAQPSAVTVSNEITLGNDSSNSVRIPGVGLTVSTTTLQFTGTNGFAGVGSSLTALNASQLTSGTVPDARIAQTSVTQHQLAITGVGTLNAGSITNGFGSIDIGADNLTATGTVSLGATSFNDNNITNVGDIALDSISADGTSIEIKAATSMSNNTASTSTTTGTLVVTGGVGIGGNLHIGGTLTGNGSGLTTLNASNLSSGTVPSARISGSYTGITGVGALDAGQITSNFGDINIGTNTFTGNGSGLTNVNADTLDSIDSGSFLRSDADDSYTGLITASRTGEMIRLEDTSATGSPYLSLYQTTTRRGYIQYVNGGTFRLRNEGSASGIDFSTGTTGLKFYDGTNTSTVWHAGNDGSGSGLDADTVDGIQAASFLRSDANDSFTGTLSGTGSINISGSVTATSFTGDGSGLTGISADVVSTPTFSGDAVTKDDITTRTESGFYQTSTGTLAEGWPTDSNGWHHLLSVTHNNDTNYYAMQIAARFDTQNWYFRNTNGSGTATWSTMLHSGNYNSYAPTLTGTGASGSWGINVTGNAATVTNGVYTNTAQTISGVKTFSGGIVLNDNVILQLGTGGEFDIYHNATNNIINMTLGDLLIQDTATTRFTFARTTGNFTATGEVTAYSDISLKDNIEVVADPLTKILSIRGVTYTRKDLDDKETRHMGVIAQEVEQYFPEVVHTTEDGIKTVNYGAMAGAFIEAFKAQQAQIDELREMVQKLANK